ncbi:MAG: phosphoribosylformylglycinamidine synthase [Gudongella sp.]|nr:phosphoribosylformylglycinamidine synthase [Gudongella sp.]
MINIRRVYVEKKDGYNIEANNLLKEIQKNFGMEGLENLRLFNRYDFNCSDDKNFNKISSLILSEPNVDNIYIDKLPESEGLLIATEFLPGQYDQRADSSMQCIQILLDEMETIVKSAKVYLLKGSISEQDIEKIKGYLINPVDSREASLEIPKNLKDEIENPKDIEVIDGFIELSHDDLDIFKVKMGFSMSFDDLILVQDYFLNDEKRNPTITELKVIDTYWSDHCRHTTFLTEIEDIKIDDGEYKQIFQSALDEYIGSREFVKAKKAISLMDLATINTKQCIKMGLLNDIDLSEEINACSIEIDVDVNGKNEKWLLMFKNETHNHPTEIEPFGGAATCLGGAIRDPLSGRSYVYQAMRVTGSGDPRQPIEETLAGKLPQRKITKEAARGYSSYGNQIGLATGQVTEIYHPGYVAKRMEVGAVIAATPIENVVRERPELGDIVLLVGGRTGRDGIGGATGSSKSHTEESLYKSGAEVQKGNAPEERKIQRLFRNPELAKMIKRCNDFGAGGVSVAIGELADSIDIQLDVIPKKYEGLDGTELAIAESQERMAVVIDPKDFKRFKELAHTENLEVTNVADITDTGRLTMYWRGSKILDIKRDFLETNGAKQTIKVNIGAPKPKDGIVFDNRSFKEKIITTISDLNICSQQGMNILFDNTVGAATVLMPFGGRYKLTPIEGMVAKIPVLEGDTNTCSLMSFGFDPQICEWSPFHGGVNSIVQAVSKIVALGGDYTKIRLSIQEYFEKLGENERTWGKPFSALLGAYKAQSELGLAAIGGKDSMSGTFKDISVPPTIITFAVTTDNTENILSPEFKKQSTEAYFAEIITDNNDMPDFNTIREVYSKIKELTDKKVIISAKTVDNGGIAAAISKMCFGNKIGFEFENSIDEENLFKKSIGSIIIEIDPSNASLLGKHFTKIGNTQKETKIIYKDESVDLDNMIEAWQQPLNEVFPLKIDLKGDIETITSAISSKPYKGKKIIRPRVFIPVFPGTNSEYDSKRAFEKAGATAKISVFRNQSSLDIKDSIKEWAGAIKESQILMIPGGFSAGDEPDGSGKFIATIFRNPYIAEAIADLLNNRDGLILGICNGFQALIKLGLLPYGEIKDLGIDDPTLTFNQIGRHVSNLVDTRISSKLSPWLSNVELGEIYTMPVSHGEGRFVCNPVLLEELIKNGQIATQYVDFSGKASLDGSFNPNGSVFAVEGLTSKNGRVFGKMGHSERIGKDVYKNIHGEKDQGIFNAGVNYFK